MQYLIILIDLQNSYYIVGILERYTLLPQFFLWKSAKITPLLKERKDPKDVNGTG